MIVSVLLAYSTQINAQRDINVPDDDAPFETATIHRASQALTSAFAESGMDATRDHADAAGAVWSSIHDMSLWAQFLHGDGVPPLTVD